MMKANSKASSPLKIVVTVIAVIVVILFVSAGAQINNASKGYSYEHNVRDYVYPAESGRFGNLYEIAVRDMDKHTEYTPEVEECRALAFYYEQAVLEHAYRTTGDVEKADQFAERMKEYEGQLGSMSAKAEAARKAAAG